MAKKKKTYDDDDGRVVADMSGVTRPNPFGIQPRYMDESKPNIPDEPQKNDDRPWEDNSMQPNEQLAFLGGAMKASVLIGGVYIGAFGLFIWLLTLVL